MVRYNRKNFKIEKKKKFAQTIVNVDNHVGHKVDFKIRIPKRWSFGKISLFFFFLKSR